MDIANVLTDTPSKKNNNTPPLTLSGVSTEKKTTNAIISSLKRFVTDNTSASTTNNGNESAGAGLGEELDEVERGEGAPLSHLTASRAKAPRRRLPSTQHLRHHNVTTTAPSGTNNTIMVCFKVYITYASLLTVSLKKTYLMQYCSSGG